MLDLNKPVQTRDGRKVRILCTDAEGIYSVVALLEGSSTTIDEVVRHRLNGEWYVDGSSNGEDLVNVPQTYWANMYKDGQGCLYKSKETADRIAVTGRIACIEFKEGDGLC